jgi:hypothetical protein
MSRGIGKPTAPARPTEGVRVAQPGIRLGAHEHYCNDKDDQAGFDDPSSRFIRDEAMDNLLRTCAPGRAATTSVDFSEYWQRHVKAAQGRTRRLTSANHCCLVLAKSSHISASVRHCCLCGVRCGGRKRLTFVRMFCAVLYLFHKMHPSSARAPTGAVLRSCSTRHGHIKTRHHKSE